MPHRQSTTPPPPQPPSPIPQRIVLNNTILGSVDQPPQSWLEMGLSGHSMTFTFQMNNNHDIILDIQDPLFMSQIITEEMRLGLEAYNNRINFPETELPFYHPRQSEMTVIEINNPLVLSIIQVPNSNPSSSTTHDTPPSMALQEEIRLKGYLLNFMKSFIIEEEYIKQYILKCPVRLNKCTMDIRVIKNSNSKTFAVFLVPTLQLVQTDEDDEEPPKMSLIIWNCRVSEHSNFRISFRSMLNYYGPNMVLLLETHMTHHQYLADDFGFSDIANVPAIGGAGGMALVWKKDFVAVDGLVINSEEIHCTINVVHPPAK